MRRTAFLVLWWAAACLADQNGAFQDGSSLSTSVKQGAFSGIGSGAAAGAVPSYGTAPAEAQFYQGGQGQVTGPGTAKVQGCATATPDADPIKRQECAAVNFLANNIQVRPQITITRNDPMILTAKASQNNAETFFQSLGLSGGTGSSTQCATSTQTTPAQYTTQTCSVLKEVGTQQCSMGRVVNIDTDANFQCDQTVTAYQTLKCRRGSSVTVGFGQCTPGAWLGSAAFVDCSWCVDPYLALNVYCGGDGHSYDVEPYRSYDGANRYDYNWIGYPWNGSYGLFHVAVAPGQSVTDYYVSNLGFGCNLYVYYSVACGTTTCTPSVRDVSSGCNAQSGSGTGVPLQLPLTKTVSTWVSDQCQALKTRTQ